MEEFAIKVDHVSKTFRIPHEKVSSLRGAAVAAFKKKSYEEFKALDDVSFEVKKGEFFGIIGRNGSGKSTLLKILAGIYSPDAPKKGKVHPVKSGEAGPAKREFHGVKINGRISPFLELGIGFNPELSGRDNVYLNATVMGLSKKEIDEKFDSIVKFSELERFIDQKLKNYSSGMQVRLAFSVSIHANREILLMDEVLAVGDSNFQSKCLTEFNRYKEMGKTVILVTHDIATVQRYCDRAMLVRNGKIVKIGNSEDVGNVYMEQNMSDEEKRIREEEKQRLIEEEKRLKETNKEEKKRIEEEKKKLEEERKNRVAEITKVEFFDNKGIKKNVFETGDHILARVYFKIYKSETKFNFGIALHNQEGNYIFGINTIFDGVDTNKYIKQGYFEVEYRNIPLFSNSYYILAAIAGDNFSVPFALLQKSQFFKVISKNKNEGIINLDYNWI